ncbi:GNAT family N-acetyltransferase [Kangiella shandongensis]|uniref:GNAT family N-acetyltransferase n=1 Tax=Kangiella shandongensis TaxID=2763258 RepID=UPI001CBDD3FA|nr:GNAT family N-acetyltransferase [Kangiella shandongensis]
MLAAKLRQATKEDAQELHEFASDSIKNIHTDYYEQKILLEEFSKESITKWFEAEDTKVFVATYMGFIIGCCVWSNKFLTNVLVSEDYQHQGVASSLWGFARDNALVSGETSEFRGEVLHRYAQELIKKASISENDSYQLYKVLEQQPATSEEVKDAKVSLRKWGKRSKYYYYAHLLNFFLLWLFLSGAYRYITNPNEALLRLTYEITSDTKVDWGNAAERENYPEWKVQFLLWRGAKPNYTFGDDECHGAASVAMLWLQPKLLKDLTQNLSRQDKQELMVKCSGLFPDGRYTERVLQIKKVLDIQ